MLRITVNRLGWRANIVTLELTVLVELDKKVDAVGEHAVAAPPDSLVEELLQVGAVEVRVVEDGSLNCGPKTLDPIGGLVLGRTATLLRLVHDSMNIVVLKPVIASPKVCVDLCPLLDILKNHLGQRLLGPVLDMDRSSLFRAALVEAQNPHLVLLALSCYSRKN